MKAPKATGVPGDVELLGSGGNTPDITVIEGDATGVPVGHFEAVMQKRLEEIHVGPDGMITDDDYIAAREWEMTDTKGKIFPVVFPAKMSQNTSK